MDVADGLGRMSRQGRLSRDSDPILTHLITRLSYWALPFVGPTMDPLRDNWAPPSQSPKRAGPMSGDRVNPPISYCLNTR
jgi:hypothetical protein